ncbi:Uncharacterized protein APZ42_021345 [Daphnia magna]|uniref:Uncharacterized protein n=1 Tax=Daphnia magna TaxID=35525 RepID=A0A0P6I7R2_9CRUS|nr:Uncharacterized protein APZ42_021345 [Daphnia magna]
MRNVASAVGAFTHMIQYAKLLPSKPISLLTSQQGCRDALVVFISFFSFDRRNLLGGKNKNKLLLI